MAVTAYAAKGDEERIRDAGAEGYVSKPISVMRFVEAVRALLAAPRRSGAAVAEPEAEAAGPEGELRQRQPSRKRKKRPRPMARPLLKFWTIVPAKRRRTSPGGAAASI